MSSQRYISHSFLDFIALVGGFGAGIFMIFSFLGSYVSVQFSKASIAEKLYIRKRTKTEMKLRTRKPGQKGSGGKQFKEKKDSTGKGGNETPLDS